MYYTIYKPSPKNTGCCASFRISLVKNNKDEWIPRLFVEFLKQLSWNSTTRSATFDKETRKSIVLDPAEVGEMIYSIDNKVPWQGFHKNGDNSTVIKFGIWDKPTSVGKSGDKGFWSGKKTNTALGIISGGKAYSLPLTSGESEVLRILFSKYIDQSLTMAAKNFDKSLKENREKKNNES